MTIDELVSAIIDLIHEKGLTSKQLNRLADGALAGREEVLFLLDGSLVELGLTTDVAHDVKSFAIDIALRITSGETSPHEGARRIWAAAQLLPDVHEYDPFIYAASEYEDRPADRSLFEAAIRDAARRLLEQETL